MANPGADHPAGSLRSHDIVEEVNSSQHYLDVVVVSPARPIFEGRAKHLYVTARDSSLGIWPRHTDLVAALGTGPLRVFAADGTVARFAVSGGFLKVGGPRVTVLIDKAARPEEIDRAAVEAELAEVQAALRHPASDEQFESLRVQRAWCQARLALAR